MATRDCLIGSLQSALEPLDFCRALWLGGSDAHSRTDAMSDIDIQAMVRDESVEQVLAAAESALGQISPVSRRYRVPEPSWHGCSQIFCALRDCPPELMIDLTMLKLSSPMANRFLEVERHGRGVVLFDKDRLVEPVPLERDGHEAKVRAKLADLRDCVPILAPIVLKAVRRANAPEAAAMYHGLILRSLVDLLRIVHCPERFDFGLRYVRGDLPPLPAAAVERLSLPGSLEEVAEFTREGLAMFAATLPEAEKRWQ